MSFSLHASNAPSAHAADVNLGMYLAPLKIQFLLRFSHVNLAPVIRVMSCGVILGFSEFIVGVKTPIN